MDAVGAGRVQRLGGRRNRGVGHRYRLGHRRRFGHRFRHGHRSERRMGGPGVAAAPECMAGCRGGRQLHPPGALGFPGSLRLAHERLRRVGHAPGRPGEGPLPDGRGRRRHLRGVRRGQPGLVGLGGLDVPLRRRRRLLEHRGRHAHRTHLRDVGRGRGRGLRRRRSGDQGRDAASDARGPTTRRATAGAAATCCPRTRTGRSTAASLR